MKILKGTILSKKEFDGQPILTVMPDKQGFSYTKGDENQFNMTDAVNVHYVSPYGGGPTAAQVMIPEAQTQIIYCTAENDANNDYFYLGSIIKPSYETVQEKAYFSPLINPDPETSTDVRPLSMPHDDTDFGFNDQSSSYGIRTPRGNQIVIREGLDKNRDFKGIFLTTEKGHMLSLNDSKSNSRVMLAGSGRRSRLEITGKDSNLKTGKAAHSAYLHASNNIEVAAIEGGMDFSVVDGRNINITNRSTISKQGGLPPALAGKETGNINLTTAAGDIVIRSSGNGVFIDCLDNGGSETTPASFQVRSQNKIHLYSSNGIDIKSAGDVNIVGRNVNIESDPTQMGVVNMNPLPPGAVNLKMAIRKTNDEIAAEVVSPTGQIPFFVTPPGAASFIFNYSSGRNIDPRLDFLP